MIWEDHRPESERPADSAERWVYWIQGGIPVARMKLVRKEDGGLGDWSLGEIEHAFFGGRGVELCWWFWARDKVEVSDRYKKVARELADKLECAALQLRKAAK